jgi:phosphate-selective porin OprO and OprP
MQGPAGVLFISMVAVTLVAAPAYGQATPGAGSAGTGATAGPGATTQEPPPFTMNLGARVQVRYSYLDPDAADAIGSFAIRRGRLSLGGTAYERFDYVIQLELAGAGARLLDANVRYRASPLATVWFGQGKAPFGRQQLTSSANLHMVDRAITDARFAPGRQIGVMLMGQNTGRTFEYGAGVYNGHGVNTANPDGQYMIVGRAVWTPLGAYAPVESAFDYPSSPRVALGVAGMHNTVSPDGFDVEVVRLGLEGAFKVRGLNATSEYYLERLSPAAGDRLDTSGWYVQGGYLFPNRRHELAARYAVISADTPLDTDTIETGLGYSLYLSANRAKLQTDLRAIERRAADNPDIELRVQFQLAL